MAGIDLHDGRLNQLEFDDRDRLQLAASAAAESDGARRGTFESAVVDRGSTGTGAGAGAGTIEWIEQWTAPLRWDKHPGNPIYGPDQSGDWDNWTNGVSIVPTPDGKTYRMYYCGNGGGDKPGGGSTGGIGFAEASVDDPLTWTEHPASPVLTPRTGTWEGKSINQPRVSKVTDTHWWMWYTGWGYPEGIPWAMSRAESFDGGVTWERTTGEPMFDRGAPGEPDDGAVFVPSIIRVGDEWWMYYTAAKANPDGHQHIHLCLATSTDGLTWTKHPENPVVTNPNWEGVQRSVMSRCYVRYDRGAFRLWYSYANPDYRIFYAESLDGVHWEQAGDSPVLDAASEPGWDDKMVEYPEVQIHDGQWRLWFCGNGFGKVGFAAGVVEAGVDVTMRSGSTATPDATWSDWAPVSHGQAIGDGRYVQVRADLWSKIADRSPRLNGFSIDG